MSARVVTQAVERSSRCADLTERLARTEKPLVLDGAMGTELERRGAHCALPLWSASALDRDPELVGRIHADYVAAGADLLTANTFRTQRGTLARCGMRERAAELTSRAVAMARQAAEAADREVFVLGSAPTLEDCYRPDLVPGDESLAREHAEHAANLAAAGVDAILIETMNTIREAAAAVRAAHAAGMAAWVSFVCGAGGHLLSGERLVDALDEIAALGPAVVGVNCLPPSRVAACLPSLRGSGIPLLVSANLGAPSDVGRSEDQTPAEFAEHTRAWLDAGARVVGGCCGTTPAHIRAISSI